MTLTTKLKELLDAYTAQKMTQIEVVEEIVKIFMLKIREHNDRHHNN